MLAAIFRKTDPLATALKNGRLAIDVLSGAGNLSHRVRLHADNICKVHAFLDDDESGRTAFGAARRAGLLTNASTNLTIVGGKNEAELEDLYAESVYTDILQHEIGLALAANGGDVKKKWSDRVRNLLRRAGKPHTELDVIVIKLKVALKAAELGYDCLHPSKTGPIDSLISALTLSVCPGSA